MNHYKKLSPIKQLLLVMLLFIIGMMFCRVIYSGSMRYLFLLWNLFLAWIPFQVATNLGTSGGNKWKNWLMLAGWLLFFPNSLYIITDLIHLEGGSNVPLWFDVILLFTAAIVGILMALSSLYAVEIFLTRRFHESIATKLVIAFLFLGSFGVYLGRFRRWNSWDIITSPFQLLREIARQIIFPVQHYQTWAITLVLTVFFSMLYFGAKQLHFKPIGLKNRKN